MWINLQIFGKFNIVIKDSGGTQVILRAEFIVKFEFVK